MNPNLKVELAKLLEEATLSNFERRKRRLARIPMDVVVSGLLKISRDRGEPLTLEEFIGTHLGFLPGERERLPSSQEYLEKLRLEERLRRESLRSSARPEPAPTPAAAAIEAVPDHADAPSPAPTFANAPAPSAKTEPDAWRARRYEWAGELGWMAR
jgi:hypothetical protein